MTPEQIAELRQKRYNATVLSIELANPDLMILRVKPDFPIREHEPGQYCTLGLGNWEPRLPGCQPEELAPGQESRLVRRAYSISCSILEQSDELIEQANADFLEFYIVLVRENPDGAKPPGLTPRLFSLKEGDRLQVGEKITGTYTLEGVAETDTVIFLSTGTGEAPHNYMLWKLFKEEHPGRLLSACCVRYQQDLGYAPVHSKLMEMFPNYTYVPLTTREPEALERKMYIQDLIDQGHLENKLGQSLDPDTTHVFLCGNPKMIGIPTIDPETGEHVYPQPTGVIEVLERRGFRCDDDRAKVKGNIHFEKYW